MPARTLSRIVGGLPGTEFAERASERMARIKGGQGASGDVPSKTGASTSSTWET
jgi:hypothetical protein